jgi:hypothetical protein
MLLFFKEYILAGGCSRKAATSFITLFSWRILSDGKAYFRQPVYLGTAAWLKRSAAGGTQAARRAVFAWMQLANAGEGAKSGPCLVVMSLKMNSQQ